MCLCEALGESRNEGTCASTLLVRCLAVIVGRTLLGEGVLLSRAIGFVIASQQPRQCCRPGEPA